MASTGEHEGSRGVLYGCGGLGLWWVSSETIGRRGRSLRAALYAEFRGVVAAVGGGTVRSGSGRVQRGCGRNGAWLGRDGARQGRAMVSWCFWLDAVQVCMKSGAGGGAVARERRCTLWTRCAARWRRTGTVGRRCTVGLAVFSCREKIRWSVTELAAR
jgi:hypothetical protein